jgi:hypothetical protein
MPIVATSDRFASIFAMEWPLALNRPGLSLSAWEALCRFPDDGRLCMSNNAAERAMQPLATGRLTGPSPDPTKEADAPGAIYTLIETAKLNDVDPLAWLADVLARLQDHPVKCLDELLPWNWRRQPHHGPLPEWLSAASNLQTAAFTGRTQYK